MSEPPYKKQRSLLDFYKQTESKTRRSPRKTTMATAAEPSGAPALSPTLPIEEDTDEKASTSKEDKIDDISPGGSQEFEETEETEGLVQDVPTKKPSQIKDGSHAWKGLPLKILDKVSHNNPGPLKQTENHHVTFKLPYKYSNSSPPYPYPSYKDRWDNNHVRMPCSPLNEYPAQAKDGSRVVRKRWDMIQEELLGPIPGPYELEEKILSYNSRYMGKWSFDVIHSFFIEHCAQEERDHFFNHTLQKIAHLALQLPHLCSAPIPLLKAGKNHSVTMSQQQIACLLANAFFCTFPRRNAKSKNSEYFRYPSINFNSLFTGQPSQVKFEKLRCIINYFRRVCDKMPTGTVTFSRQYLERFPNWDEDSTLIRALHVSSEGTIEDDGEGLFQVDFANMYLGGGVLGHGCVQEEIRFLICPEMIISRLITECLDKRECLIMKGCERFSNYDGYASKFEWKSDYIDKTERDSWGRIMCEVVAIDALVVRDYKSQFQPWMVKRELNKAFCGFYNNQKSSPLPAVCTGNWGCGAFGGDKQLKALIQLMAASKAGRDLCYFTFDDEQLRDDLFMVHKLITDKSLHIGDLLHLITNYYQDRVCFMWLFTTTPKETLYTFLQNRIEKCEASFSGTFEARGGTLQDFTSRYLWIGVPHSQSSTTCNPSATLSKGLTYVGPKATVFEKEIDKKDCVPSRDTGSNSNQGITCNKVDGTTHSIRCSDNSSNSCQDVTSAVAGGGHNSFSSPDIVGNGSKKPNPDMLGGRKESSQIGLRDSGPVMEKKTFADLVAHGSSVGVRDRGPLQENISYEHFPSCTSVYGVDSSRAGVHGNRGVSSRHGSDHNRRSRVQDNRWTRRK